MKQIYLLLMLCSLCFSSFSQSKNRGTISIASSVLNANALGGIFTGSYGDNVYTGKGYSMWGVYYSYHLKRGLYFETGIEYADHNFETRPSDSFGGPVVVSEDNIQRLTIPLSIRADFFSYFFINAGLLADIQLKNTTSQNQSGLGALIGIGARYEFKNHLSIFVNPFGQVHNLFLFNKAEYKLSNSGVKIGMGFRL